MRTWIAIALVALATSPALARDSTWLVCKGVADHGAAPDVDKTYLVASVLEHRAGKGDGRELRRRSCSPASSTRCTAPPSPIASR